MEVPVNVELTPLEIKRLINALHDALETQEQDGKDRDAADNALLMKLVEALR